MSTSIFQGKVKPTDDAKVRARHLADEYDFDIGEAKKIWCFGPETRGPNLLVDATKSVQGLAGIRDSMMAGFQWATLEVLILIESSLFTHKFCRELFRSSAGTFQPPICAAPNV